MNGLDWAIIVTAFTALAPILMKILDDLRKLRANNDTLWLGLVARGFVEAQKCGYLRLDAGVWIVAEKARSVYAEIQPRLQVLCVVLRKKHEREPTDAEVGWSVESNKDLQQWLIDHACPKLGLNQHGCIAIAAVLAREPINA